VRRRPAELHGARGLAELIRPVLASLADPSVTGPPESLTRERIRELLGGAAEILDAAAHAIRHGRPVELPPEALAAVEVPESGHVLAGTAEHAATRLRALLHDVVETTGGERTAG
ncbi:FUSC family protein, partial [Streptomyces sp. T-3]|nr:FUSC family protein [Streptomyces sp. T-3]